MTYKTLDLGAQSLLTRRAAVNTEDDLFDKDTLDAKWTAYTNNNLTVDLKALPGWCKGTSTGYKLQAVPAGDWTIETEVIVGDSTAANYENAGLILTDGTNWTSGKAACYGVGMINSLTSYRFVFENFTNGAFVSTLANWTTDSQLDHYFLRINKTSTTYRVEWSTTGKTFKAYGSNAAIGFVPAYFGFGSNGPANCYFNGFYRY